MVRFTEAQLVQGNTAQGNALWCKSGFCLSTDQKPIAGGLANGSCLIEIDTGNAFFYDEENVVWKQV